MFHHQPPRKRPRFLAPVSPAKSIFDLPDDVLHHILHLNHVDHTAHFTSRHMLFNPLSPIPLMVTCKAMHRIVGDLVHKQLHTLDLAHPVTVRYPAELQVKMKLNTNCLAFCYFASASGPRLKKVVLPTIQSTFTLTAILDWLQMCCPNIQHLALFDCGQITIDLARCLQRFDRLEILEVNNPTPKLLDHLDDGFRSLKQLAVIDCAHFDELVIGLYKRAKRAKEKDSTQFGLEILVIESSKAPNAKETTAFDWPDILNSFCFKDGSAEKIVRYVKLYDRFARGFCHTRRYNQRPGTQTFRDGVSLFIGDHKWRAGPDKPPFCHGCNCCISLRHRLSGADRGLVNLGALLERDGILTDEMGIFALSVAPPYKLRSESEVEAFTAVDHGLSRLWEILKPACKDVHTLTCAFPERVNWLGSNSDLCILNRVVGWFMMLHNGVLPRLTTLHIPLSGIEDTPELRAFVEDTLAQCKSIRTIVPAMEAGRMTCSSTDVAKLWHTIRWLATLIVKAEYRHIHCLYLHGLEDLWNEWLYVEGDVVGASFYDTVIRFLDVLSEAESAIEKLVKVRPLVDVETIKTQLASVREEIRLFFEVWNETPDVEE